MAEETDLATRQGAPWGKPKYGDPGAYVGDKDASDNLGIMASPEYQQFLLAMAANRAKTDQGTRATLGANTPVGDPYAAERENNALLTQSKIGAADYRDRQQAMAYQNQLALQKYLQDLEDYEKEQAIRNEYWDKAGRTAMGGGQAFLSFYTGGAAQGKKPQKNPKADPYDQTSPDFHGPVNDPNRYGGI